MPRWLSEVSAHTPSVPAGPAGPDARTFLDEPGVSDSADPDDPDTTENVLYGTSTEPACRLSTSRRTDHTRMESTEAAGRVSAVLRR
jgi:hypothetical protein